MTDVTATPAPTGLPGADDMLTALRVAAEALAVVENRYHSGSPRIDAPLCRHAARARDVCAMAEAELLAGIQAVKQAPAPASSDRYERMIRLCQTIVDAHQAPDGGPTVAGHFLGVLRGELMSIDQTTAQQEWCVFYGGPDPDNCAGVWVTDDQVTAEQRGKWLRDAGIAHRTRYASRWVVDTAPAGVSDE